MGNGRQIRLARLALLAATVIWGTSFVIVQRALADLPVFHFLALRFALAALLLGGAVALRGGGRGGDGRGALSWRDGSVLGLLLFAGFTLQTFGLQWTTPSRSAFLTGLAVVFVPGMAWLAARRGRGTMPARSVGRRPVRLGPLAATACAAAGLYVLYQPGGAATGAAAAGWSFGRGDALTLAGTFAFACHIVGTERVVRFRAAALMPLAALQFAVVAVLAAPSLLLTAPRAAEFTPFALFTIALSGIAGTVLAFLCQLYAQRHLPATEAAVLLTFEPVVAALFSVAVGREAWSPALVVGGVLVIAAMLLAELGGDSGTPVPPIAAPGA